MTIWEFVGLIAAMDFLSLVALPIRVSLGTSLGTSKSGEEIRRRMLKSPEFRRLFRLKIVASAISVASYAFSETAALVVAGVGYGIHAILLYC